MPSPVNRNRRGALKRIGALAAAAAIPQPALRAQVPGGDIVVFLPGITGSVLKKGGKDVWAATPQGVLGALATLGGSVQSLRLASDPADVDDLGDGVVASAVFPDVHLIPGFWKIDGYSNVRKSIGQRIELRPGVNYFDFPYDWRRDNRVAARKLGRDAPRWLEQWKKSSGNKDAKIMFVVHSMGGLVARYYLECMGGWRYTRALISFGTPYRGSLNALDFLANGYQKSLAGFSMADLSQLMRSFTSVYQLLPRYPCIDMGDGVLRRPGEVSGLPNIDATKAKDALAFHREIDEASVRNAALPEYRAQTYRINPIVGVGQRTKQSARLEGGRLALKYDLAGIGDDGDGTVPRPSAIPIGADRTQDDLFVASTFFASGIHGSLQNLEPVGVQVANLLSMPNFEIYRGALSNYSLEIDDAYVKGESVLVTCSADEEREATLSIEHVATGKVLWKQSVKLLPSQRYVTAAGSLPVGTYRARLQIATEPTISDVFIVST